MMATAPMPAKATATVASVMMTARKVSERVVEKHEPMMDEMPIRTRWIRAISRGRGLDQEGISEGESSEIAFEANSTSTADIAAVLVLADVPPTSMATA